MRLVDLAVAAIVDGLSVSGASKRDLTITGDPAACLRLKEAEGARALWTPPIAGARPNDLGKFSGISVYAIPADVVSDRTLLNVVAGAKIVATIDMLQPIPGVVFLAACQKLWGPAWRSHSYALFGVPDRTLRRWVDGKSEIPRGVGRQLLRELDIRRGELNEIRDRIAWERR